MTSQQIQTFAQNLPADAPYYGLGFRDEPGKLQSSSMAQRLNLALSDAAFGWNVATSYSTARVILPELDWPSAVVRAYEYLQNGSALDRNVALAHQMTLPDRRFQRDLLRAALICDD